MHCWSIMYKSVWLICTAHDQPCTAHDHAHRLQCRSVNTVQPFTEPCPVLRPLPSHHQVHCARTPGRHPQLRGETPTATSGQPAPPTNVLPPPAAICATYHDIIGVLDVPDLAGTDLGSHHGDVAPAHADWLAGLSLVREAHEGLAGQTGGGSGSIIDTMNSPVPDGGLSLGSLATLDAGRAVPPGPLELSLQQAGVRQARNQQLPSSHSDDKQFKVDSGSRATGPAGAGAVAGAGASAVAVAGAGARFMALGTNGAVAVAGGADGIGRTRASGAALHDARPPMPGPGGLLQALGMAVPALGRKVRPGVRWAYR